MWPVGNGFGILTIVLSNQTEMITKCACVWGHSSFLHSEPMIGPHDLLVTTTGGSFLGNNGFAIIYIFSNQFTEE